MSHDVPIVLNVTALKTGAVAVDLASAYNTTGIYSDGSTFEENSSLDGGGYALSAQLLGATQVWDGVLFQLGRANAQDVVTSKTVALPSGKFAALKMLATGVDGDQESQTFTVTYADGTSSPHTQGLSDWAAPGHFGGESAAVVR